MGFVFFKKAHGGIIDKSLRNPVSPVMLDGTVKTTGAKPYASGRQKRNRKGEAAHCTERTWRKTRKGKAVKAKYMADYWDSEKGRRARARAKAKRK